jgi:acyl carrier protein
VTSKANFKDDLGLDSLDAVEVVMAIEDEVSTIFIRLSLHS